MNNFRREVVIMTDFSTQRKKKDFFHPIHRAVYLCISLVRKCKPTESPPHYFALIFSFAKISIF
jgi:hypothetical protein